MHNIFAFKDRASRLVADHFIEEDYMDSFREFLVSPLGSIFAHFLRALVGAVCVCAGIQVFDFKNRSSFFTLRKIAGLFLLIIGASRVIYALFC
jgi:hypothetical protein